MLTFKEKFDQLTYAYSVPCPNCGAQWSFYMKSLEVWGEIHKCNCPEYHALIKQRLDYFEEQLKAGER